MLVIAPLAILIIAGFIGIMVNMTGDVLATQQRSRQTYNTNAALTTIERDVTLSSGFDTTIASSSIKSPQGSDSQTNAAWNATAGGSTLLLTTYTTTNNPLNSSSPRELVYQGQPNACTGSSYIYNPAYNAYVIYFLATSSDGSSQALWQRTILPSITPTPCGAPWQRNSCAYGATINASPCQTHDEEVLGGVTAASFTYYVGPGDTTPTNDPTSASTVEVSLTTSTTVAGRPYTMTASMRATTINQS